MRIILNGRALELGFRLRTPEGSQDVPDSELEVSGGLYRYSGDNISFSFDLGDDGTYILTVDSRIPVSVAVTIGCQNQVDAFHLIPCNIHGDNNLENARPGYFPNLTTLHPESPTCSPEWEFRADRASHPVSMVIHKNGIAAISIDPYSKGKNGSLIRNGVFSALPSTCGVSLGYRNHPYTFKCKEMMTTATTDYVLNSSATGRIYSFANVEKTYSANIIRDIYYRFRDRPSPSATAREYLESFITAFRNINWSEDFGSFTNCDCKVPDDPILKPWRPLYEIGWSGGGVIVYPLIKAMSLCGLESGFEDDILSLIDLAADRVNPGSGFFKDLIKPINGSDVNGWWAGYIVKDCHCAYTNGSAAYYMLKLCSFIGDTERTRKWMDSCLAVLDTAVSLQMENGNYGYTYSTESPEILDAEGFSGCWFAAACAMAYDLTGEDKYLKSAEKAMDFYYSYVRGLNCWGTPMDTWKSVDQEGNLAFIKAAAVLHRNTGGGRYLEMLEKGAQYEYLWRYGFKAVPEHLPLKDSGWNSCGGSVTSVSNPHIHPMGLNITGELLYLYRVTGDPYHLHRASDGICWGLASANLYPETTGYGARGVMTERWCPSDGLTIEKFSDTGDASSIWFTFNGWAGATTLEGLTGLLDEASGCGGFHLDMEISDMLKLIERRNDK